MKMPRSIQNGAGLYAVVEVDGELATLLFAGGSGCQLQRIVQGPLFQIGTLTEPG